MAMLLMVMGGFVSLLPWLLRALFDGRGLAALTPIGVMVFLVGALLAWLAREEGGGRSRSQPVPLQRPVRARAWVDDDAPWSAQLLLQMSWPSFDALVEAVFQAEGFQTRLKPHARGTDLWLASLQQPGGPVTLVRCFHGQGDPVDLARLHELVAEMGLRQIGQALFATASGYTEEARAYGQAQGLVLWSSAELLEHVQRLDAEQQQALRALTHL